VIARRMVATDVTAFDLLMGSVALSALLVVRFYFLPGKPKESHNVCDGGSAAPFPEPLATRRSSRTV
ncbi:MAG: hypothetical protein ACXV5R_11260, partial [Candidatus Angelobacter sp.]